MANINTWYAVRLLPDTKDLEKPRWEPGYLCLYKDGDYSLEVKFGEEPRLFPTAGKARSTMARVRLGSYYMRAYRDDGVLAKFLEIVEFDLIEAKVHPYKKE